MTLKDVVILLPEDKRTEAEKTISDAIATANPTQGIITKEQAFEFIQKTGVFRSALDAEVARAVTAHDQKFQGEKLPGIIEEELRKRNPPKDPRDVEIQKLTERINAQERATLTEKQKTLALRVASEKGIPVDFVERFIGENDEATTTQIGRFADVIVKWRDDSTTKILQEKLGSNALPKGGNTQLPQDLKAQYELAEKAGNADLALAIKEQMLSEAR